MELKLLLSFIVSMLGSLFGNLLFGNPDQVPPSNVIEKVKSPVVVEHNVSKPQLKFPGFITSVPAEHFSGVSEPSNSLAKARKSAIGDVIRQILGSISTQYDHNYFDRISGNVRNIQRVIHDKLSGTAHGIVLDVERNIVRSTWLKDDSGKFVYFILVYYPEQKIQKMRRLSKGAKVIASIISKNDGYIRLKISEINGVAVTLSSAYIKILRRNKFAKAITLFLFRVPQNTEQNYSVCFDSVKVCGNSKQTDLSLKDFRKNFADYLLGADFERATVLKGHDEIGRPISLWIAF